MPQIEAQQGACRRPTLIATLAALALVVASGSGCAVIAGYDEIQEAPPKPDISTPLESGVDGADDAGPDAGRLDGARDSVLDSPSEGPRPIDATSPRDSSVDGPEASDTLPIFDGLGGLDTCVLDCPTLLHRWSLGFGGTSVDRANSVAVDGRGNVTVTGRFEGTTDFGGGPLTANYADIFVASYDTSGAHRWSKSFGAAGADIGYSVAVAASGQVVIAGDVDGEVDFGSGWTTSTSGFDGFVSSYDVNGTYQWFHNFGGSSLDASRGVAIDASGNTIVTGHFGGSTTDFGGGAVPYQGRDDVFVASYGPNGAYRWSKGLGGSGDDIGYSVAVDGAGNVTVTGTFAGTASFGGNAMVSAGSTDIFVASFSATGTHRWSQRFGGAAEDHARGVAVDGSGNVVVVGDFQQAIPLGPAPLTSAGAEDIFVLGLDSTGAYHWSRRYGGAQPDRAYGVAVDGDGNVAVTGEFGDSVDFGGGALTSAGASDIFVLSLTPGGQHRASTRFGGTKSDIGYGVAADGSGNLSVAGSFAGAVDFGGGPLTGGGGSDVFVLQLDWAP